MRRAIGHARTTMSLDLGNARSTPQAVSAKRLYQHTLWRASGCGHSDAQGHQRKVPLRALNGAVMVLRPGQTLMWSVAEIGSGVELAELPVASDTMVFE